jgi:hypothetical protein
MRHTIGRDALYAGMLGAGAVALWFLGVDILGGRPLQTPEGLGRGVLGVFGLPTDGPMPGVVAFYTVFHVGAFIGIAAVVSAIVHVSERQPGVLAGAMILFVVMEVAFYGLSAALAESPVLGVLDWNRVATGNLVAALVMGTYLWRTHPLLQENLDLALSGRDG